MTKSMKLYNFQYIIFFVVSMNILVACVPPNASQGNTAAEIVKLEHARAGLPQLYNSLLLAAKPMCKNVGCNYPLEITKDKEINAYADGSKVYVTTGMLKFAHTNEELAIILSHELAHNLMTHITSKQKNQIFGLLFDLAAATGGVDTRGTFTDIAGQVYSQEFELEADYVGLYIMARAGYPVDKAAFFWRKMAAKFPKNIRGNFMSTHPGSAQRFITLDKTAQEINSKKRNKKELIPEFINKTY